MLNERPSLYQRSNIRRQVLMIWTRMYKDTLYEVVGKENVFVIDLA